MKILLYQLWSFIFLSSCGQIAANKNVNQIKSTRVLIDTCDDPDAGVNCCFVNMPTNLTSTMNIVTQKEPGEKLSISGTIFKADGKTPYPNIIIYAYHTDTKGYYSKTGKETGFQKWHGRLHGWCKTDINGNYKINSIRPARYPGNNIPAHIHAAIINKQGKELISDFVFKDDNLVNEQYLKSVASMVGGTGVVKVIKSKNGIWIGQRNIILTR